MLEVISHRGNLNCANEYENEPNQIQKALELFRVEVDVWNLDGKWLLGHDEPVYNVEFDFFDKGMFLHCKNMEAVENLCETDFNWFWHQADLLTLTSHKEMWCFPGNYMKNGITVLHGEPELQSTKRLPFNIKGICTDYPLKMAELLNEIKNL